MPAFTGTDVELSRIEKLLLEAISEELKIQSDKGRCGTRLSYVDTSEIDDSGYARIDGIVDLVSLINVVLDTIADDQDRPGDDA